MIEDNIFDGDIVFIKECQTLKNGEIGAVLIDDGSTLKKFYKINGSIVLQASNSTYSPIVLTKPDSGKVFVFPEFLIENNSEKPITINSWSSFNSYADSFLIDIDMKASISEDSKRLSGKVAPEKKLQGSLSYQLDKDYKELEINFNLSSGSKEIKFIYKK